MWKLEGHGPYCLLGLQVCVCVCALRPTLSLASLRQRAVVAKAINPVSTDFLF